MATNRRLSKYYQKACKIMENVKSEQFKEFATELEKIKKEINDINCRREAQDDAFERELGEKQEKLTKIQQRIDGFNISIL